MSGWPDLLLYLSITFPLSMDLFCRGICSITLHMVRWLWYDAGEKVMTLYDSGDKRSCKGGETLDIYASLNQPQKEAVFHTEGPLLILAGAGSGKTRVLTHRIALLIAEQGVNPWNILAITFTNKAAREMRERVDRLVEYGAESVWVSTFHACCVRILRRYIEKIGYSSNFVIYDTDDQKSLMKEIMRRLNIDTKAYKEKGLLARISHAKERMLYLEDLEKGAAKGSDDAMVAAVYREYQAALKNNNALDFDDLLVKAVELFEGCPDVLASYQERFRYIMIDEYQDTNDVQFRFVHLLASRYRNLCVVGDDDQSIYKFRGANIYNILNFEDSFPEAKVIRLEQNYRSTKTILAAANHVIANNTERKEKTLWTENEEGEKIHIRQFDNGFEEAEYVVGEIERSVSLHQAGYRDYAILYRTNAQSRMFEEKLLMAGIPYKIVGGVNFYARKESKDLLCYLRTVDNASDDLAVARILNVPKRGIGATTQGRVQDYATAHGISFYDALEQAKEIPGLGRGVSRLDSFIKFIRVLRTKAEVMGPKDLLNEVIEGTGYIMELEAEGTDEAKARIENINELISTAAIYEERAKEQAMVPTLSGFLEEVALVADVDSVEEGSDYVVLMTLHSAKGLEFPRVFMAGMEEGLFPGYAVINYGDPSDMEEERRLCYVGITRAKQVLTMTQARTRMVRGEMQYFQTSRFVSEIPRELVDFGNETPRPGRKIEQMRTTAKKENPLNDIFRTSSVSDIYQPRQSVLEKADKLEYGVGDQVRHIKFGVGVVQNIVDGGRDYEVTVVFDRYGVKKMFASFAKLKKV